MSDPSKILKNTPLILGAVVLALVTLFGFLEGIPFAMKDQVKEKFVTLEKSHDKEIADLKENDKTLWALKNQDNEWYREVAQEQAVLTTKVGAVEARLGKLERQLDRIEELLRARP